MALTLDIRRNLNLRQIFEISKFEIFLQKKKYIIMLIISLIMFNLAAIFSIAAPTAKIFVASVVTNLGPFLIFITLFFAGGILADEFDKRTALTNFTKTDRNNFFIGKTIAAFSIVLVWITPPLIESFIFCLVLYGEVPVELYIWFGYYCLVGGMFTSLYLLCSAIFNSGSQAMIMGFVIFIITTIAFGITGAFFGLWYLWPIYVVVAEIAIFYGPSYDEGMIIDLNLGIIVVIAYFIPCLVLSYLFFKKRDV